MANGHRVILPEIADYEVRRELLRMNRTRALKHLDLLGTKLEYLPISTAAMHRAVDLWAQARRQGQPTAGDKTIDSDMILVAQALTTNLPNLVIASTNVGHIIRFIACELWESIPTA
jgi:predicted nucleic acid-binding protein